MTSRILNILKIAGPLCMARLLGILSTVIGMMMIAHLGHAQLAAGAYIATARVACLVVLMSVLFSVSPIASRLYGAKKYEGIGQLFQAACLLGLLLSVISIALFYVVTPFLHLLHQAPHLLHYVRTYFHTAVWGVPAMFLVVATQQIVAGTKNQNVVMLGSVLGLAVFLFFAFAWIFGSMGFHRYGIQGFAFAQIATVYTVFIYYMIALQIHPRLKQYPLWRWHGHQVALHIKKVFKVGWPLATQFGAELLTPFVLTILIGWLGENALAAAQVIMQYGLIMAVPMFAMSEATSIVVGHAYGAKDFCEAKKIGNVSIIIALTVGVIAAIIFISFPDLLASAFMEHAHPMAQKTMQLLPLLFVLLGISRIFDAIRDAASGALRALYDVKFAMYAGVIQLWAFNVALGYVLAFPLHFGLRGFYYAAVIGFALGGLLIWWRWWRQSKLMLCRQGA